MRTTASFDLFPDAPSERAMARARWLAREGRTTDAESAYREILETHPDLKAGWAEYFELLRAGGRAQEALRLADRACAVFGATGGGGGFAFTLRGAALIELGRYREALTELEQAVDADPDLALVWHELGYAAYKLGDRTRALLALDRAFALEPHTETLRLRGRILRDAGRYAAAEVAFEGAAQAAEHAEQRAEAEREIAVTRRYGVHAPRKPDDLSPAERWFADSGAVVLAAEPAPSAPSDSALLAAFAEVARGCGWEFGQLITVGPPFPAAAALADQLRGAPRATGVPGFDPGRSPLVAALRPDPADRAWRRLTAAVAEHGAGLVFALEHPGDSPAAVAADVIGVLTDGGARRARAPNPSHALAEARHPGARLAGRRLRCR